MAQRKRESPGGAAELTELSLLTATALMIFVIEQQIPFPLPIPGTKLGLANVITVCAAKRFRGREVLLLVLARIFLGSVFMGTFLSPTMIFSLAGGLTCLAGMLPLMKILDEKHIWLGSVFGAVLHNTGQIIAAVFVMKTAAVVSYYPFLIFVGCIAGAFTGLTAQAVTNRIKR